jgi:chaperonin GroES
MKVPIHPSADRLLIELIEIDPTTPGEILLPSGDLSIHKGRVIAAGPGRLLDDGLRAPIAFKRGTVVLFSRYSETTLQFGKRDLCLVREDEVLASVKE